MFYIFINVNTLIPLSDLIINAKPQQNTIQIAIAGDVLLDGSVEKNITKYGSNSVFTDFKKIFTASDVTMVNLECPISNRGTRETDKQYTFRVKPEFTKILKDAEIDIVSLANNHVLDFGVEALKDTISNLTENTIAFAGAGMNEADANKPVFIEKNGFKLAVLASSRVIPKAIWRAENNRAGVATTYDPGRLVTEITNAAKKADGVLVYVHWGKEGQFQPLAYQKKLAKMYIDAGADIIIGSHPHVLQGFEYYKGKLIAYSLGNFIFTNIKKETMLMSISLDKEKKIQARVIPCSINSSRTTIIKEKDRRSNMFKSLTKLSYGVFVDSKGYVKPVN